MKAMKVMRFNDSLDSPALIAGTAPVPQPGREGILIRVQAAGVTPTELQWYPTTHTPDGGRRTGAIPGHEFSGVVEAAGPDADQGQIGQEVFGMNGWFADGATVPIGALTAWQGLFDRANLKPGERILIHGGSGAVGIFAIQLARRAGAHVITSASRRNFNFLSKLGANEMIDYRNDRFEDRADDLDVVFDAVGGETLKRSWSLLKPSGRMVTIAADSEGTKDERIEKAFFIVEPNQQELTEISRLLDSGELQCFVDAVVPFVRASDAYCGTVEQRHGRGKMVVSMIAAS